jgi:hypothetical protein
MFVISFFTEAGTPKTGLSPVIDIWRVSDNFKVVTSQGMSEVGGGFYKYDFTGYDASLDYAIRVDGGATLPIMERYAYAGNEGFHDDITDIQDKLATIDDLIRRILGLSQENYRLFNTTYDLTGEKLTGCTIKTYGSKADCDNDISPIATYTMTAEYGMNFQLSSYKVVRTS